MQLLWWHWIVAGIVLGILETLAPAFILIWFALGAVTVGLLMLAMPAVGTAAQFGIWTVASSLLLIGWFRVFKPQPAPRVGQSNEFIGECGLITRPVSAFSRGTVRFQKPMIGSEEWECLADAEIHVGERARVVAVEGSLVRVVKA